MVGWRPIIGTDCRPVAIMELTSEDAAVPLIASDNVHFKLKKEKRGVHEINQFRVQYGEYQYSMVNISTLWRISVQCGEYQYIIVNISTVW
jgi:hypothetical protein